MYTVLINNDNTVTVTERQRIMQNSKLIDILRIIVPKTYNELDMSQFTARLEYLKPISHEHNFVELEIEDADYKTNFLLYKIRIDTTLTSEVGDVQFMLTFIDVNMTDDGVVETPVRKIDIFTMPVFPIANWFVVPDSALSTLDQRIIANQEAIMAMADLQSSIADNNLDDIKLDTDTNTLYGTSGGTKKGTGVKLEDLGDVIADSTSDGMVYVNTFDEEDDA